MTKILYVIAIASCLCGSAASVFAQTPTNEVVAISKLPAAERSKQIHEVYERKFGGFVIQPGSRVGTIGFVNAQKELPAEEITSVISTIKSGLAYNIVETNAVFPTPFPTASDMKSKGLNAAIYVVSSDDLPSLLVSPEENWSVVNVRRCREGLSDDILGKRLFALRCRGELIRGFAQACGIWTSNYKDNILNVRSPKELDTMKADALVADMLQRCKSHLALIGVTEERKVMYTRACHEGWAPAPTNDYQKAIWDKVHKLPTEPIKIEPEAKKVKE